LSHEQLNNALRAVRSHNTLRLSSQTRDLPPSHAGIVAGLPGDHPLLDSLRVAIAATAKQDGAVLICGETGTGKRQIAEALYQCSSHADGPFVPVSCATFPEALLAIELFGCESGALPGTTSRRIGRIEMAEGGVLLLEDIEVLSVQSQASLLAFLRSGRLERVGSTRGAHCDVRLIASTTANLEQLVEQGVFREDLFYALQGLVLNVPPLRDYVAALPDILAEFDAVFQTGALSAEAWKALHQYDWPGNVKELANFATQMGPALDGGLIDVDDLPWRILGEAASPSGVTGESGGLQEAVLLPVNGLDLKSYLATLEKNLITQALEDTGFVVARAADRLHIRRTTLVEKMRKYGLQRG
jgi:sigma-54 specific flagellar transcriptional regulator A